MEDIENFLHEQLRKAIEGEAIKGKAIEDQAIEGKAIEGVQQQRLQKSVFDECKKLQELIAKKDSSTGAADDATRKENLYYLNNIVAEWRAVLENHHRYSPTAQITLNGQLPERLKKIRKELEAPRKGDDKAADRASQEKEKYDEMYRGLRNPYHVDRAKIWGIDDKSKAMERLLVRKGTRNNGFQAIGIVGMTGVGKTTFCQVAFNNEEVKKHFLPRIWVEISNPPKEIEISNPPQEDVDYKKEVVKSFLRSLGFEDNVIDEMGGRPEGLGLLLLALRKQLQGKRYLVVLDDIWHLDKRFKEFCSSLAEDVKKYEPGSRLSYGLPKASGGCVIVTSRSESWAVHMVGEKNLHRLTPLEDKKSIWNIFTDTVVENNYTVDPDMEKAEDEIVKRCAGLPMIAKMLGEIAVKNFLEDNEKGEGSDTTTK